MSFLRSFTTKRSGAFKRISGYQLFLKDSWSKHRGSGQLPSEIVRQLGKEWTELPAERREKYLQEASKLNEVILPNRASTDKGKAKTKPLTAYTEFYKAVWPSVRADNPDMRSQDITKMIGSMWRNLSEDEKRTRKEASEKSSSSDVSRTD